MHKFVETVVFKSEGFWEFIRKAMSFLMDCHYARLVGPEVHITV